MEEGYLIIETNAEHPGLVRLRNSESAPPAPGLIPGPNPGSGRGKGQEAEPRSEDPAEPQIRYVARFNDLSAAQMQTHTRLHRRLVDIDAGLYRCDPATAVAAAQSLELKHRQIYLDPDLASDAALTKSIDKHHWRHKLADRFWQVVGILAVLYLIVKVLFGF